MIEISAIILIAIGFIFWSQAFIKRSSFITIDGKRSYSLVDDAMISMRYAWNFSHGNGLVWNRGQYVQGYTNLLMTLLMAVPTFFFSKTTAVLAIQVFGAAVMLAIAWLTMKLADHILREAPPAWRSIGRILAFVGPLVYYPLAYWSLMGMETGLLTMLLLAAFLLLFQYEKTGRTSHLWWSAFLFGSAFLTRNDSIIFFFLAWVYLAWVARAPASHVRMRSLAAAGCLVLFMAVGQLAFQYLYYGELLPNTYTLKLTGMPLLLRLENGVGFILPFLQQTALILALAVAGTVLSFRKEKLLLLSVIATAIAYQVYIGGDVWNYWRIPAPAIPLALILDLEIVTLAAGKLAKALASSSSRLRQHPSYATGVVMLLALASILVVVGSADTRFFSQMLIRENPYEVDDNRDNINTAIVLNHVLGPDATIGVTWGGALPYYTDFTAIDFLGKTDRHIASLPADVSGSISWYGMFSVPGHNKYDLTYSIMTLQPTFVERFVWGRQDISAWGMMHYVRAGYKKYSIYLLKDSPDVLWSKLNVANSSVVP